MSKKTIDQEHVWDGQRCQTDEDDPQKGRLDANTGRLLNQYHQTERPSEQGKDHRGLCNAETRDRGLKDGTHGREMSEGVNETEVDGKAHQRWNRYEEQGQGADLKSEGRAFVLLFEEQSLNDAGHTENHEDVEKEPHARGVRTHDGQKDVVRFGTMKLADTANDHTAPSDAFHSAPADDA